VPGRGERSYRSMSLAELPPEVALGRLSCLIHTPGTMQKRCGVVPTAVEPGPRVLLSQRLEWRENRARSTRPRDNHLASECDRLTGESKAHNHADALAFQPFEPVPRSASGVPSFARLVLWAESLPHRPRVPRGTRQRRGLKAERRGYRLSAGDPLGPVGFAASGSRAPRVLPDTPACEPSSNRVPWSR